MHKGEDLQCKVLFVIMIHLNIFKYFSFGSNLFRPELFTFSRDLTVISEMCNSESQRV